MAFQFLTLSSPWISGRFEKTTCGAEKTIWWKNSQRPELFQLDSDGAQYNMRNFHQFFKKLPPLGGITWLIKEEWETFPCSIILQENSDAGCNVKYTGQYLYTYTFSHVVSGCSKIPLFLRHLEILEDGSPHIYGIEVFFLGLHDIMHRSRWQCGLTRLRQWIRAGDIF